MQTGNEKAPGVGRTGGHRQGAGNVPLYNQDAFLNAAKAYHERGWQVIPVLGAKHGDRASGKKPSEKGWPEAQIKPDEFPRYWGGDRYRFNIGILTGAPSGIVVLDFDDGEVFHKWSASHPEATETYTVRRPNAPEGRQHLYFTAARPEKSTSGDGWDFLSTGKQAVAPPSLHYTGVQYEVTKNLPPLPWDAKYLRSVRECSERTERQENTESRENEEQGEEDYDLSLHSVHSLTPAKVIQKTMPTQTGQRERMLFALARGLKLDCGLSPAECKPYVINWHTKALQVIGTKEWGESWSDFVSAYDKAKKPLATDALRCAFEKVRQTDVMKSDLGDYGLRTGRFAGVCRELARQDPDCVFFIAVTNGGEMFDVAPTQISRWLRMLEADELIELVTRHTSKKAARYRWIGPI